MEGRIITRPTVLQTGTRLDKCSVCGAATMQRCECATVYIRLRDHFQS